jgi:hypothetical protein
MITTLKTVVFSVLILGLVSCSIDNPVDAPLSPHNGTAVKALPAQSYNMLQLPKLQGLNKLVPVTSTITAADGGQLAFEHSEGSFYVKIVLKFSPGAVSTDKELQMLADDEILAASFGPEGTQFQIPGELYVEARGLDFSNVSDPLALAKQLRLLYFNETTQQWEPVDADGFKVDVASGTVICKKGLIPHFSRYGFGY